MDWLQKFTDLAHVVIPDLQKAGVFGGEAQLYAYNPQLAAQTQLYQQQVATGYRPSMLAGANLLGLGIVAVVLIGGILLVVKFVK